MNKRNASITRIEINGRKVQLSGKIYSDVYNTQKNGTEEVIDGVTTFVQTTGIGKYAKTIRVFVR